MNEIKLIIWDLDDTLWQGTLAEREEVVLKQEVIDRIQHLLDRGIVHSLCSKNDPQKAKEKLKQFGIYDLFVFPKISFADKGLRIKEIIQQTQLREQNVLFVDDNEFVLREALYHNPQMTTKLADQFMQEDVSTWGKEDSQRQRLAQYKILEKKEKNKRVFLKQNKDERAFLKESAIKVQLIPFDINDKAIDRIIELVNRANQLNFTQSRIKYDYLFSLFELKNGNNYKIHVQDQYGDYGIVGYACVVDNTLLHFVFSCRTLGMRVEAKTLQWLQINYPKLKISFNTAKVKYLDESLDFIAIELQKASKVKASVTPNQKILIRGPCLTNAISFLLSEHYQVDEEIYSFFEYANLQFLRTNMQRKQDPRFAKTMNAIENNEYSMIINFLESDYYSGHYMFKKQTIPVASNYIFWKSLRTIKQDNPELSEHLDEMMINGMQDIPKFNLGNQFSPWPKLEKIASASLSWFGGSWMKFLQKSFSYMVFNKYCGYILPEQFKENLLWYIDLFPKNTPLVFINPPETKKLPIMNPEQNKKIADRTKTCNEIIRAIANEKSNVVFLEMEDILHQEDIIDSFSHLKRQGYIKLSQSLLEKVNDCLVTD